MSAYPTPLRRRARLLAGCAIALGLSVQAQAQNAFQADVTGVPLGSANVSRGQTVNGRLTDVVTVNSKQAVINWSATGAPSLDGSVKVLDTNNQLLFTADGNTVGDYTVLNRITPTASGTPAIRIDGIVRSQLDFGYGATQPGGNILFYSPGGIIAGATSQFDVGSLVLSAADILYDPDSGLFGSDVDAQSGTLRFRGATDSRSVVTVENGASLKARDNYVALVAPRIVQAGLVEAAGSIAYVAAESADITIPMAGGLFDIGIVQGSKVDAGGETTLTHSGTTTGPEDTAQVDNRRIYMIALPKNDAVTMLVSGKVGYTPAANVQLADGQIILAAANSISSSDTVSGLAVGSTVQITGGTYSSDLKVVADQIALTTSSANVTAAGDLALLSDTGGSVSIQAAGGIITAADIILESNAQGGSGGSATGGQISIAASASGKIQAASISAGASGSGGDSGYGAGDGTGGTVTMTAIGGGLIQASDIDLLAKGFGGDGSSAGKAEGGAIVVNATGGSILSSNLNLDASSFGGQSFGSGASGAATGGTVTLTSGIGGQITGAGTFRANGNGGRGFSSSKAGNGTGGTVNIQLTGGNLDVSGGTTRIFADGIGGNNFSGGAASTARGGTVNVSVGSASSQFAFGTLLIGADGRFEEFFDGSPPPNHGGAGVGGTVTFAVSTGAVQGGELELTATGSGAGSRAGGVGGSGFQGRAALSLSGGTLNVDAVSLLAEAYGGDGNEQGDSGYGIAAGSGGSAGVGPSLFVGEAGAILTATGGSLSAGSIDVSGDSSGGSGGDGREFNSEPLAGNGGAATGGLASFTSSGSASLSVGSLRVRANANADPDGEESFRGGSGGSVRLSDSSSSDGLAGSGGASLGGLATITIDGSGSLTFNEVTARANGFGGDAGLVADFAEGPISGAGRGGNGGAGAGGTASILINTGLSNSPEVSAAANGFGADGGRGPNSGNAGDGLGGSATVTIAGGTTTFDRIHVSGSGFGGNGADGNTGAGGSGGKGQGLNAALTIASGANVFTQELTLYADGEGGRGGDGSRDAVGFDGGHGGDGKGGNAALTLTEGSITLFGGEGGSTAIISSNGLGGSAGSGGTADEGGGGNGGNGGDATGGTVTVLSTNGSLDFFSTEFSANAMAGSGGSGGAGAVSGASGVDGQAIAGAITIDAQHQGSSTAQLDFGSGLLTASSSLRESRAGLAGKIVVNAVGGNAAGAIRFSTLAVDATGALPGAGTATGIRFAGSGTTRVNSSADLNAVGDIVLAGRLDIGGPLTASTNSDLLFTNGADVSVLAGIDLRSGDDIIIGSGALLRGTNGTPPEAGYGGPQFDIRAGLLDRVGEVAVGEISSFILEGDVETPGHTVIVSADAVVARTDTQFSAGNLYVNLRDIPEGGEVPPLDDLGQLRPLRSPPCLQGDVCFGNVSVTGNLEIGNAFLGVPINVRLNGGVDAERVTLLGRNVRLGQANQANFIKASQSLSIASLNSSLFLDGALTVQGGVENTQILSALNINGSKASISATGTLNLFATNNITLGSLEAAAIRTVDFTGTIVEPAGIKVAGLINIGKVTSADNLDLLAGTGVTVGEADLSSAALLRMITDAGAASLGKGFAGSVFVSGDTASATVDAVGTVEVEARLGDATLGTIKAGNIFANAAGNLTFADLTAENSVGLSAGQLLSGGNARSAFVNLYSDGDIKLAGTLDAVAPETGYGDGGAIDIYALGDMDLEAGAQLLADENITLRAGDDVRIGAGATLLAGRDAPASSAPPLFQPGLLRVEAGAINVLAAEPVGSDNVHAIVIGNGATLTGRTVVLTGEAIQAAPNSSIVATNLFVRISAAPPLGAAPLDDGGALSADCVQGNICLGGLTVAEQLRIGEENFIANRVLISGAGGANDVLIRSQDTLTLAAGLGGEAVELRSLSGDVVIGAGARVEASGGSLTILAARDLAGSGGRVVGSGEVVLGVGRNLSLGTLQAASLRGVDFSAPLQLAGAVDIDLLTSNNDIRVKAGTGISIGTASLGTNGLDLSTQSGPISLGSVIAEAVTLTASAGAITVADLVAPAGVTAEGTAISLTGSNGLLVQSAVASGPIELATTAGDLAIGTATSGSIIDLTSASKVSFSSLDAAAALTIAGQGDVTGGTAKGASVAITSPGSVKVTDLIASSGDLSMQAGTGVTLGSVSSANTASLKTAAGALVVTSDIVAGTGLILSAPSISLTAKNSLNILQADATAGDLVLKTLAGDLAAGISTAAGAMSLDSGGDLTFASLTAQQAVSLASAGSIKGGSVAGSSVSGVAGSGFSADALTASSGGIDLAANGIAVASLKAVGTATLAGGPGTVAVSDASAASFAVSGGSVSLASTGSLVLTKGNATSGDLTLSSAQGDISLGQASAAGTLSASAQNGTLNVSGAATGSTIAFTSKDLAIGSSGQIGSKTQTKDLTLISTADRVFLGDATGAGYRIDNAEMARIVSAEDITLRSNPSGISSANFELLDPAGTNIVMGSFTFDGAQLGSSGQLTFDTQRSIGVTGNVQFKNFNNDQYVLYKAGTDISLAAETGLVTIKNASGGLAGTLELRAQQVHAMSTKARAEIAGLQLNEVRQRLGTNDQLENDGGYFQANRIIVNIGRLAFIQNSGANGNDPDLKRGITANELIINAGEGPPLQLVINGKEGSATGEAFRSSIALPNSIDPQSGFNGCVSGSACIPVIVDPGPDLGTPAQIVLASSRDQIQDEEEEDEKEEALQAAQTRPDPVIQMAPAPTSRFDPLIDEPVTGAGNEDLWEPTGPTP
ncbi:hypothetical protein [Sphingomonas sp.]|jgi:hypothetical protein|uniref:beta strand repeat-containing protein n=1 Tax=Sphingomonas sp. TaxID=28214 RepID=UPI002DEA110E|nr:hypothetical protein [Sphingomonas sp.]